MPKLQPTAHPARALGMGQEDVTALREVGKLLAFLKEPEPPRVPLTCSISCRSLSRC